MELTSPLNVENATRKTKLSIISPVNAQHYHRTSIRRGMTQWLELCTGICARNTKSLAVMWYEHQPQPVTENENAKLLWDYIIRTDRVIPAHRPDLALVDKTINKVSLIDIAVPWHSRAKQKEQEKKRDKYQDLRIELRRLWDKPVEIVPLIVRALGTIPKSLKRT